MTKNERKFSLSVSAKHRVMHRMKKIQTKNEEKEKKTKINTVCIFFSFITI